MLGSRRSYSRRVRRSTLVLRVVRPGAHMLTRETPPIWDKCPQGGRQRWDRQAKPARLCPIQEALHRFA